MSKIAFIKGNLINLLSYLKLIVRYDWILKHYLIFRFIMLWWAIANIYLILFIFFFLFAFTVIQCLMTHRSHLCIDFSDVTFIIYIHIIIFGLFHLVQWVALCLYRLALFLRFIQILILIGNYLICRQIMLVLVDCCIWLNTKLNSFIFFTF